ncbi:hypothetical protein ACVNHC_03310 [Pannonibacter sp. Q-1]
MSAFSRIMEIYNFAWMLESHAAQRLAWRDAEEMRVARIRAEAQASAQLQAMLDANPSGQLGNAALDDEQTMRDSGLL